MNNHESAPLVNESFAQRHNMTLKKVGAYALAAVAVVGSYVGIDKALTDNNSNNQPKSELNGLNILDNCNNLVIGNPTSNSAKYDSRAFFSKSNELGIKSLDKVTTAKYIYSLFGSNGSLQNPADKASLGIIESTIAIPSGSSKLITSYNNGPNTSIDYLSFYNQVQASFNSVAGGKQAEIQACKDDFTAMINDGRYVDSFAQNGQVVTIFEPIRDKNTNKIIGLNLVHKVVTGILSGVEFKPEKSTIHGFPSILLDANGVLYVKGVYSIPKPTLNGNHPNPNHQPETTTTEVNGNIPSGTIPGNHNGNIPSGTIPGNHNGNIPKTPTPTKGPKKPVPTTTQPKRPPTTTTTQPKLPPTTTTTQPKRPPTTTTTVPPTTTTTVPPTTTTTVPPTKGPVYCDPNISQC